MKKCSGCGVEAGQSHEEGCYAERCPACGCQMLSCDCSVEEIKKYKRIPWTGELPGIKECRRYNLWSKLTNEGWVPCDKYDSGARENLNRLYTECDWNPKTQRMELRTLLARKKLEKEVTEFVNSDEAKLDLLIYGTVIIRTDTKGHFKRISPVDVFVKTASI